MNKQTQKNNLAMSWLNTDCAAGEWQIFACE